MASIINWKLLAIGMAIAGVGKWLYDASHNSPFLTTWLPGVQNALAAGTVIWEGMVVFGIIIAVFGLLWHRWIWAIIFGSVLGVGVFLLSFAHG